MTTTFTLNRDQVILGALKKVGAIAQGETPNADQIADASATLNSLVKAWQADGLQLWKVGKGLFNLIEGQKVYNTFTDWALASKPLRIYDILLRDNITGQDIVLNKRARDDYMLLAQKTSFGNPNQFWYEIGQTTGNLYIYPVADTYAAANKKLYVVYQEMFDDMVTSTDELDFPSEWIRALVYALATDLADEYGVGIRERQYLQQKAAQLKSEVLSWDQEDSSLYFQKAFRG